MSTYIHISGLSPFCTDDKLRQAFIPFGTVVLAKVLRDESGHALGLGAVRMARREDMAQVFTASQHSRFEIAGARVDLWEPAEPEDAQPDRAVAYDLRDTPVAQETRHENSQTVLQPLAMLMRHLIHTIVPTRTVGH